MPKSKNSPKTEDAPKTEEPTSETETTTEESTETAGLTLFSSPTDIAEILNSGDFEEKTLPPIVKPSEVPVGSALRMRVDKIEDSPQEDIKSGLLRGRVILDDSGKPRTEICFPVTAVIGSAIGVSIKGKGKDDPEEIKKALEDLINRDICLVNLGRKESKTPGHSKMHNFRVAISASKRTTDLPKGQ